MYGLKQSNRMCYQHLSEYLVKEGYMDDPICPGVSRPDPKRSTRGNRRVPLSGSQFPGIQPKAGKASDILACLKKIGIQPNLPCILI